MAKYTKYTMEDITICPYCGSCQGSYMDGNEDDSEVRFRCDYCLGDYYIIFDENSWDEEDFCYTKIEDITDRHRKSLLEE